MTPIASRQMFGETTISVNTFMIIALYQMTSRCIRQSAGAGVVRVDAQPSRKPGRGCAGGHALRRREEADGDLGKPSRPSQRHKSEIFPSPAAPDVWRAELLLRHRGLSVRRASGLSPLPARPQ